MAHRVHDRNVSPACSKAVDHVHTVTGAISTELNWLNWDFCFGREDRKEVKSCAFSVIDSMWLKSGNFFLRFPAVLVGYIIFRWVRTTLGQKLGLSGSKICRRRQRPGLSTRSRAFPN